MFKLFLHYVTASLLLFLVSDRAYTQGNSNTEIVNFFASEATQNLYKPTQHQHHITPRTLYEDESMRLPFDTNADTADSFDLDLVDVDNDGDKDIFIAEGTAGFAGIQNRLLINDGKGYFTDETTKRLPPIQNSSVDVDFFDINGDGFADAVIANVGPTQLLLNNGKGSFKDVSQQRLPPPPPPLEDVSLEINFFDVDHDGDKDILIANELPIPGGEGAQNRLYINNGQGVFTDETSQRLPLIPDQSSGFAFGDIDHDGDGDIIVSNEGQNRILINLGGGNFSDETTERLPLIQDASRHVVLADVNGDDKLDIFVVNSRAQQNRLYLNNGQGFFKDVTLTHLPRINDTSIDVDLVDLNGDGALDAVIANSGVRSGEPPHILLGEQNRCYMNSGNGIFIDVTQICLPIVDDPSFDAEVGDINGDGRHDMIFGNAGQNGSEQLYIGHRKVTAKVKLKFKKHPPRKRRYRGSK